MQPRIHEVVLIVIPFRRIVQTRENNGSAVRACKGKSHGSKGIVIDGDDQIGLRPLYLYQSEITSLSDGGFSGVQTFCSHIKMIENHTPIKKRTLPQGTLDTLKLGRPADMVRPVAVDHENPGRLGSWFH
jgi:hypothetical protein